MNRASQRSLTPSPEGWLGFCQIKNESIVFEDLEAKERAAMLGSAPNLAWVGEVGRSGKKEGEAEIRACKGTPALSFSRRSH